MSEVLLTLSPEEKRALVEAGLLSESEASPDPGEYLFPHEWHFEIGGLERRCDCGSWVGLSDCESAVCPACGCYLGYP